MATCLCDQNPGNCRPHWETPHAQSEHRVLLLQQGKQTRWVGTSDSDECYICKGVDQHILRISDPFNGFSKFNGMTLTKKQIEAC